MTTIRTKRGKTIDMDSVRAKNEKEIAAGNMSVNARGDLLGPGGKIVKKAEERVRAYYKDNPNAVKRVSIKKDAEEAKKEAEKKAAVTKPPEEIVSSTKKEGKNKKEVILDNGDIVYVDKDQDPGTGLEDLE